ncbi:MAG TPA: condensation domain-containing protein, partial [Rugosimonospora sp.]|nr:condensation domain-containing protein [Rugosimonospora sp.]
PLPTDRPRPARPNWRGGAVDVAVKPETAEGLRALATAHRASPYMVMLAAYHAALGHLCGATDQAVGIPVSGRTVPDLDGMVGYLVNTVVVRSRQRATDTFGDLVTHVRAQVLDAFGHRAVPFKWVVDELNPSRASTANPLFQAAFDMDPTDEGAFRLAGLRVEQLGLADCPAAKFDLTLHVEEAPDKRLFARLEYATAVIDEATAQAWAAYCEALFEELVRAPQEPLTGIRERLVGQGHLPARSAPVPVGAGDAVTPTGTVPRRLLDRIHQVWREVLAVEDVDVSDNFFDVGGDSLRAVALAGRLREDGLDVSAADVFAHQTVEELAHACAAQPVASPDSAAWPGPVAPFAMLSPQDRAALPPGLVDAYPLAAMQLGMLIEMRARPGVHTYQDSTSYRIRDGARLDPAALQRAAQLVVDRHEVLRTTFDLNGYSVPLQLVHGSAAIVVGLTDHGTLGAAGWQPRLEEHAARERRELMDLASAPLIRVHAHTAEDSTEWWITLTECHPIIEGWSFHTMLMEILTGYREIRAGRVPPEPEPVRFRYADYIVAETAARQSAEHRAYWRGVVEGRVDVSLPSAWQDSPDTPRDRYQHLVDFRDLDAELHRLATETRTSMKAVLLAAHLKVMSMVFGSDGFFTGLVCDARPEVAGADRVLGMYLNTVPFPMPSGARTWGELIRAVYDDLTEMWPHRVFPMQAVQHESGAGRLLDVFFNYLDFHQVDSELVDEDRTYNDNENEFALHVFTFPGILKFNTTNHRLSRAAADRLAGLYRTVLVEMCTGPDGDAGSACLPAAERARLDALGTGSATGPEPVSIVDAFADAVRRYPDEPAVRCGDRSLTYRQLDARSAAVARQLRSCGAGPGQLVAVAPHRNENTVAALLGTWLAGAAWTLVEPAAVAAQPAAYAAVITPADPPVVTGAIPVAAARMSPARPGPQDVACVVSGAVFTHRALAWAVRAGLDARGVAVDPGHTWLGTAPLASAAALCDLLVPLTGGGVAVLSTRELPEAVAEVAGLLAAGAVTHVRTTAPVAAALPSGSHATIIIGGGEVDALPGVGVRVVDAGLRPVATGVVGELCVTGPALAEGYHADPAGTAARFVPDPAGPPGSRLHRTGLLARFAADGTLEQLGPVDQHAWVDGHRDEWYRTREALDAQP